MLKRESAATTLTQWELTVQRCVAELLAEALSRPGSARTSNYSVDGSGNLFMLGRVVTMSWTGRG